MPQRILGSASSLGSPRNLRERGLWSVAAACSGRSAFLLLCLGNRRPSPTNASGIVDVGGGNGAPGTGQHPYRGRTLVSNPLEEKSKGGDERSPWSRRLRLGVDGKV
jgi:hypothetical protein